MKKTGRKIISLLLAVLMVMSSLTVGFYAFAADDVEETTKSQATLDAEKALEEFQAVKGNLHKNPQPDVNKPVNEDVLAAKKDARQKFDAAFAKVKALSEDEKLSMDIAHFIFALQWAQNEVAINNNIAASGEKGEYATVTYPNMGTALGADRSKVEDIIGKLPTTYSTVLEVYAVLAEKVKHSDPKLADSAIGDANNGLNTDEDRAQYAKFISVYKEKMPEEGIAFADYFADTANSSGVYLYFYDSIKPATKSSIKAIVDLSIKKAKGLGISEPNWGTYYGKTDSAKVNYTKYISGSLITGYSWVEGKGPADLEAAVRGVLAEYIDANELYKANENVLKEVGDILSAFESVKGIEKVVQEVIAVGKEIYAGNFDQAKAEAAIAKVNAVANPAIYNTLASSSLAFGAEPTYMKEIYGDDLKTIGMMVGMIKPSPLKIGDYTAAINDKLAEVYLNDFNEFMADADVANRTPEMSAKAAELYAKLYNKGAVDAATLAKLAELVKPYADAEDYADFIANFTKLDICDLRPAKPDSETEAAWYENGIQMGVDGLWATVKSLMGLAGPALGLNLDLSNGLENVLKNEVYKDYTINLIFDLLGTLSKDETIVEGFKLGFIIDGVLFSKANLVKALEETKFAGAVAKINAVEPLTKEEKDAGMTMLQKIADTVEFTAADFGFKNGEKDGFLNAVLAIFRPLTAALAPGAVLSIDPGTGQPIEFPLNVELFDFVNGNGEYVSGFYAELIPLLEELGVSKSLMTAAEYKDNYYKAVEKDGANIAADQILKPIIDAAFADVLDGVITDPLNGIIAVLPRLANALNSGLITDTLKNALSRGGILAGVAASIPAIDGELVNNILHNAQCDSEGNFLGIYITTDKNGKDIYLTIPDIDWDMFANCCTVEAVESKSVDRDYFVLRTGDPDTVFTKIFEIVYNAAFAEPDFWNYVEGMLADLIKGMGQQGGFIKPAIDAVLNGLDIANWSAKGQNYAYGKLLDYCVDQYALANNLSEEEITELMGNRLPAHLTPATPVEPDPTDPTDPPSGGNGGNTGNNGGNTGNNGGNAGNNGNGSGKLPTLPDVPDKGGNTKLPSIPKTGAIVGAAASYAVAASLVAVAVYMLLKKKEVTE